MNVSKKYIQYIAWCLAIVFWAIWVQERIDIFTHFNENYKSIGYLISTNDRQLVWYLLLSAIRASLVVVILYRILPKYGFSTIAVYKTLMWIAILMLLEWGVAKALYEYLNHQNFINYRLDWTYDFYKNTSVFIFWSFLSWIIAAAYQWFSQYEELKRLYQNQRSFIKLKEQLNPHFIFNTLNSLYELSLQEKSVKLQESILDLTDTIRYTIDYAKDLEVPLCKEISAIKSYIAVQQRRIEINEITVNIDASLEKSKRVITPMLLLNYIENAFKHGYNSTAFSEINVVLKEEEAGVYLMIKNTNHAIANNSEGGNQINKRLLNLNYPNKHQLKISSNKDFYILELWMNLN